MSRSRNGDQTKRETPETQSPELDEVGRKLASLALERLRQDGRLKVRQREQLRRTLATAANAMDWVLIAGSTADQVTRATSDITALADAGANSLERDLAEKVADKNGEMEQLKDVARSVQELAADADTSYPTEVEYSHTARHGSQQLVTKTETLTLGDADEAQDAAARLEKRMEGWERLRDQMLQELEHQRRQIDDMKATLSSFLDASQGLVREVLATLD
jgi:uncharacterized protein YoxC